MYYIKTALLLLSILHVVWLSEDVVTGGETPDKPIDAGGETPDKPLDAAEKVEDKSVDAGEKVQDKPLDETETPLDADETVQDKSDKPLDVDETVQDKSDKPLDVDEIDDLDESDETETPLDAGETVQDKPDTTLNVDELDESDETETPLDAGETVQDEPDKTLDVDELDESDETAGLGEKILEPKDVNSEYADDDEGNPDKDVEEEEYDNTVKNEPTDDTMDGQNEEKFDHKYKFPYDFYEIDDLEKQKELIGGKIPTADVPLFVKAFPDHRDELEKGIFPRVLLIDFVESTEEYFDADFEDFMKFYQNPDEPQVDDIVKEEL